CTGTFTPDGNWIIHPVVSAVAVNVYLVTEVSFPDSGVATTAHLPAKSARVTAGAGGGAGVAAAFAVSAACSLFAHATTIKRVEASAMLRRISCMETSIGLEWGTVDVAAV